MFDNTSLIKCVHHSVLFNLNPGYYGILNVFDWLYLCFIEFTVIVFVLQVLIVTVYGFIDVCICVGLYA